MHQISSKYLVEKIKKTWTDGQAEKIVIIKDVSICQILFDVTYILTNLIYPVPKSGVREGLMVLKRYSTFHSGNVPIRVRR